MEKYTLIATARFGLEMVVKNEINALGFKDIKASNGKVEFNGSLEEIPRANLWLRAADRVFLKMGEFQAVTFDELFDQCYALPWEDFIPPNGAVIVNVNTHKSEINSERSSQSIVKKSIVERLKDKHHLEWLEESGPRFSIQVTILKDTAVFALDTSGSGLFRRGYRKHAGEAPLKETLAAGLVLLSRWRNDEILIDPMCGSGTIVVEAAMIGRNIAPGLNRSFAAESWDRINDAAWTEARMRAKNSEIRDYQLTIFGYDIDGARISDSKKNAEAAGVAQDITFGQKDINDLWIDRQFGSIITNPPYGRRMAEYQDLNQIYLSLNKTFRKKKGWSVYVLTADSMFPKYFKRARPNRVRKMYNGKIRVNYFQYYGE